MNKGIAITTILTLVVGIVVVGIIIYLVYTYVLTPVIPENECRALAVSWCTQCGMNWTTTIKASTNLQNCASTYFSSGAPSSNWQCNNANSKTWCKAFIPV